jgi:hypothetical protein
MTAFKRIGTGTAAAGTASDRTSVPKASWIWFVVLGVIVVAVSTLGQFTSSVSALQEVRDDDWVVATFGTGMGLLTIAVAATAYRRGERWAGWVLAYYPPFFAVHIAVFGTWIPDAGLLVLSVAALVAGWLRPVRDRPAD